MKKLYTLKLQIAILFCLFSVGTGLITGLKAQSFSQNDLNFNGKGTVWSGTSLTFGPDGRLYVAEYTGEIKIFTVEQNGPGDYVVIKAEVLTGILQIQDYNDDGTLHSSAKRETLGITVAGTAANPVIYVTSSDFRIGAGGGGDLGLDTNSGIITRLTWNGSSWDEVDIVRGLPRSEENHATNGLEFVTVNGIDYLIVAQGGHTNAGGPSKNFAYTTEYALSAAILSVNLTQLESMPILDDNGRKYIYDIPTLDDPSRPNVNGITDPDDPGYDGIDVNDPFGGNDGLNQAMIVPGGPVQIFSPGYRNAYDLVVTEAGAVFVTDNGANGGWGGFPVNEGGGTANNDYDPNEPGSSSSTSDGEKINNKDNLNLVTLDIQNYSFGSFYGGHPTPVRANPFGAGLYTNPAETGTSGAVFRTLRYHPNKSTDGFTTDPNLGLPANWPPVSEANPVEGDWRGPGMDNPDGPNKEIVTVWGTNTNGIDEYSASNYGGAMKGNLIAGVNTGELRRVELNPDGSLLNLTPSFASNLGGNALGITCNGDFDPFPGTIWVVTLDGNLVVLEPDDFVCPLPGELDYDPTADYDQDGYSNQDEEDNGTDPCNGGSQPNDFDKVAGGTLISDLNDTDDDNDGISDAEDPFQLGDPLKSGSDAFVLPVINELFSSNTELKGYLGLGLTGLMNNGAANPNWLEWLDRRDDPNDPNPNDILGGAIGAMTMQMTSGTALGSENTQEKGFQYGVQVDQTTGVFTVAGNLVNFHDPLQLYGNSNAPNGELGIFIGDGTQSNYIKFVLAPSGIKVQQEVDDTPLAEQNLEIPAAERPVSGATLYFRIDPSSGEIVLEYRFDNQSIFSAGTVTAQGAVLNAIQQAGNDLAVGFIGTSNAAGVEVEGTWDFLNVTANAPVIVQDLPDLEKTIGAADENIDLEHYFYDDKGLENITYSVAENTNTVIGASITNNVLTVNFPSAPAVSDITIRATDSDNNIIEQTFKVTVHEVSAVLYRVNSGGSAITSIDEEMDWGADTSAEASPYLSEPGTNKIHNGTVSNYTDDVDQTTTPVSIFGSERYDGEAGAPNLTYSFPIQEVGFYEVRLYMGNGWSGTAEPGQRVFDVDIEGVIYNDLDDLDLSATFGHEVGGVITHIVEVTDGSLDISFIHGVQNPLINGIEILGSSGLQIPIEVAEIPDQINTVGEDLDGNLVVSATGGDGNLSYSMTGAPLGVSIEPTNGQIGGSIDLNADTDSPYTVTITVDDNDDQTADAVTTSFNWKITTGEPVILEGLPDLERSIGAADENINLNEYFYDDKGTENLVYTVETNTNTSIGAVIDMNILTLSFPSVPGMAEITIRATDGDANFVEQIFTVTVTEISAVLHRVNAGGPAITAIDDEMDWRADTALENSPYLTEPGSNSVAGSSITSYTSDVDLTTTPTSIYDSERYDAQAGAPNLTYSFPVTETGNYQVRLYMGDSYAGTSEPGQRMFDVEIEGVIYPDLDDLDLVTSFGHQVGGIITLTIEVTDGFIDISFIHGIQNPIVNGIEIIGSSGMEAPIEIAAIPDQTNTVGEELDGSLVASATGGEGDLVYSVTGAPLGVTIDPATGVISGTIDAEAHAESPYNALVTVDDSDENNNDAVSTGFSWTITNGDIPIQVTQMVDQTNYAGEVLTGGLTVTATGGDGDLVYSMTGAPLGVTIDSASGVISGTIDPDGDASSPYSVVVTVDDSDDQTQDAVSVGFTWTVTESPQTQIEVAEVADQANMVGDVLDKSLVVSATGGDGDLVFSMTGAPLGVIINSTTGVINGTIDMEADISSPYSVVVEVDDSDGETTDAVSTSFTWTVTNITDTSIVVAEITDQTNVAGDVLDESLAVSATGGDGDLVYSMTGAPLGVIINSATGIISGTIDPEADAFSPYSVVVEVDDSDGETTDAVTTSFTWTISAGNSVIVENIPDIERVTGTADEDIYLDTYFDDDGGVKNLTYTVEGNTDIAIGATVLGNILTISYAPGPAVSDITIRATDASNLFVEQTFRVTVVEETSPGSLVLYRVNTGGPAITSIDGEMDWGVDTPTENSPYLIEAGGNKYSNSDMDTYIDEVDLSTTPTSIYSTQRFDNGVGEPNMTYSFPVAESGTYEVRLYMGNGYTGTSEPGTRIFDVEIEGVIYPELDDLDLSATFGHKVGAVLTQSVEITDGAIEISFIHGVENPLINGIEILGGSTSGTPIEIAAITDQTNIVGDVLDESLVVSATGGDGELVYSMTGAPLGVTIDSASGVISGTIASEADVSSPYSVVVSVDDSDGETTDAVNTNFTWTITETPQTPIEIAAVTDQTNTVGDVLDGSLVVSATGGDGDLVYSMTGAPLGVTIDSASGVISGTIDPDADVSSPYSVVVEVDDSDGETTDAVSTGFTWTITETPQTLIEIAAVTDQTNVVGDVLDGSLIVSATGGDGDLVYSMTGAPLGVTIDSASGVISGTIDPDADVSSPYSVVVEVDDSDEYSDDSVSTGFTWTVTEIPQTLIEIAEITDQSNIVGDELDGSLVVSATGGDGDLVYSMTGAPLGIIIDSASGIISGTIDMEADASSPYSVVIEVDDIDEYSDDSVSTGFIWTIVKGEPVVVENMPDLERYVNTADENIDLNVYFDDNQGVENLTYTVKSSNSSVGVSVTGNILKISYPSVPTISDIKIIATDLHSNSVEQSFTVTVMEIPLVLHRVNAGGPAIAAIDDEKDWGADTSTENSISLTEPGSNTVAGYSMTSYDPEVDLSTTPTDVFNSERSDGTSGPPNMTYSFPVPKSGTYQVRLYFGSGHNGNSREGRQIFDVEIEGVIYPELDDLDLIVAFGHQVGGVISQTIEVVDGFIDISFLHGAKKNPMINGIEIINASETDSPIQVAQIQDQDNVAGDELDGTLTVSASGGDGDLIYSMTGAPSGVIINSVNGTISGIIDAEADLSSPYSVVISVDDSDGETTDAVSTSFTWTITGAGNPIEVAGIPDQMNIAGEELDGSLVASASGGDGDLVFSMTGGPMGVSINSVTGVISGTIDVDADASSPYNVIVSVDDSDDQSDDIVSTGFTWTVTNISDTSIVVAEIADQTNVAGDELDGSLAVSASGGDGDLVYSMTGAPLGVVINSTTGVINGTIDTQASTESPYSVTVNVDDSDDQIEDAVSTNFTWTISSGEPFIAENIPDMERFTGTADEDIYLDTYFDDNDGVENLVYSIDGNTDPAIGAVISGNILTISYPSTPAVSDITVTAQDDNLLTVNQTFRVIVVEEPAGSLVLYRVNSGGPGLAAIDEEMDWGADTSTENSPYLTEPGSNTTSGYTMTGYDSEVDLATTPTDIFSNERSDGSSGPPNMTYSFPVTETGFYEIRLYFGNGHPGSSRPGRQIFDVSIEGVIHPELDDVDLAAKFGHQIGGVISKKLEITDGFIDISFLHGAKKSPLINGIEIIRVSETEISLVSTTTKGGSPEATKIVVADEDIIEAVEYDVQIYPNPVVSEAFIKVSDASIEIKQMYLYGYSGQLIRTINAEQAKVGEGLYMINVFGLPDGVYLVKLDAQEYSNLNLKMVVRK